MTESSDALERLISRYLDHEATADEARSLRRRMRDDPHAAALFEEYREVDREARMALRAALGTPAGRRPGRSLLRAAALAAAACIGLLVCLPPRAARHEDASGVRRRASLVAGAASWFAPPPKPADTLERDVEPYAWPQIRLYETDRDWILLPGEGPDEFLVIEINKLRVRAIRVQGEF